MIPNSHDQHILMTKVVLTWKMNSGHPSHPVKTPLPYLNYNTQGPKSGPIVQISQIEGLIKHCLAPLKSVNGHSTAPDTHTIRYTSLIGLSGLQAVSFDIYQNAYVCGKWTHKLCQSPGILKTARADEVVSDISGMHAWMTRRPVGGGRVLITTGHGWSSHADGLMGKNLMVWNT